MARRRRRPDPPLVAETAPPCEVCGEESDDLAPDGRRLCGLHDERYRDQWPMLRAMRAGAWNPYLRPIFDPPENGA